VSATRMTKQSAATLGSVRVSKRRGSWGSMGGMRKD